MTEEEIDAMLEQAEKSVRKMSRRSLEAHYVSAMANWNIVINERNRARRAFAVVRGALDQALVHSVLHSKKPIKGDVVRSDLVSCSKCALFIKTALKAKT
jgi:hypothetical protein